MVVSGSKNAGHCPGVSGAGFHQKIRIQIGGFVVGTSYKGIFSPTGQICCEQPQPPPHRESGPRWEGKLEATRGYRGAPPPVCTRYPHISLLANTQSTGPFLPPHPIRPLLCASVSETEEGTRIRCQRPAANVPLIT